MWIHAVYLKLSGNDDFVVFTQKHRHGSFFDGYVA